MQHLPLDNIFIPSKTPSKKIMIVLHGRGDSAEGFSKLPEFLDLDDMNYLLLDAPFEYFNGFSWYQLPPDQLPGIAYSSKILTQIFDTLFETDFEASQSYLFGFSQGALLSFEFGARYAKKLAGYIAVSGYIYDTKKLIEEMNPDLLEASWWCSHGMDDRVLPFEQSALQVKQLQDQGWQIDFHAYDKEHTLDLDEIKDIKAWISSCG